MNINDYADAAMRTRGGVREGLKYDGLLLAAVGAAGESGEFLDYVKKIVWHETTPDYNHIIKEIGDILWYAALACYEIGVPMSIVAQENLNKLAARYPSGFSSYASNNRVD